MRFVFSSAICHAIVASETSKVTAGDHGAWHGGFVGMVKPTTQGLGLA